MKRIVSLVFLIITIAMLLLACDSSTKNDIPTIEHTHSYGEWETTKAAGCIESGLKVRDCSCGDVQERAIEPIGHSFGDWVIVKESTCTEDGLKERYCYCGESEMEHIVPTGHTEVVDKRVEPTCNETGLTDGRHCSVCGTIIVKQEIIPANGHTEVVDSRVEPTCTQTGLTEGKHCSVCKFVLVDQIVIPMIPHVYSDEDDLSCNVCFYVKTCEHNRTEIIKGYPATCTSAGLTDGKKCSICDEILVGQESIDPNGHTLIYIEAVEPTANDPGNIAYYQCSVCKKNFRDAEGTVELSNDNIEWNTYTITFYDNENGTFFINRYKKGEPLTLKGICPNDILGYTFLGWHTSWPCTNDNSIVFISADNTKDNIDLYANREKTKYNIEYVNAFQNSNPLTYTIEDEIAFSNPESAGLIFSRWTDENGNTISGIKKGTTGDIKVEANWKYAENLAISNPDKYTYVGGVVDSQSRYHFIFEIGEIENIVLSTKYNLTYDASTDINYQQSVEYRVQNAEAQAASKAVANSIIHSAVFSNTTEWIDKNSSGDTFSAKYCPEIEFEGIKAKAQEFSFESSDIHEESYTETNVNVDVQGVETEDTYQIASHISYVYEETVKASVSINLTKGISPIGAYSYVRAADVKVYAIVTYDPINDRYYLDIYTQVQRVHDRTLFELTEGSQYSVNIEKCDQLDFEIPVDLIPDMFYTVKYDANGGTGEMPATVHEVGLSNTLLKNVYTRDGYEFLGWKTSTDGNTAIYTDLAKVKDIAAAGETITLYAHWVPYTYTVKYDSNGGVGAIDNSSHIYDESQALNAVTDNSLSRTGYTFLGWNRNPNEDVVEFANAATVKNLCVVSGGTVTLYAIWSANEYTVTLNANGGNVSTTSIKVTYDGKYAALPSNPTRENYAFVGWKLNSSNITKESKVTYAGNHTLTAQWTPTNWYLVHDSSTGYPDVLVTDEDKVYDQVNTHMNVAELLKLGYTKITVDCHLRLVYEDQGYQQVWIYNYIGGKQHYSDKFDADSGWTSEYFSFTINLVDLVVNEYGDGTFVVEWGAEGNFEDDWTRGRTTFNITAIK